MIIKEKEVLYINALVENAVELIPNFWPMRSFIHHNPLHGFESMPFEEAVTKAHKLFHAKKFLSREVYQEFYNEGKISKEDIRLEIVRFLNKNGHINPILEEMLLALVIESKECYEYDDIKLNNKKIVKNIKEKLKSKLVINSEEFHKDIISNLGREKTIYDVVDKLFGTRIAPQLDDIVSQIAMRFLGEGQAVWNLAGRERGMFLSWKEVVLKDKVFYKEDHRISRLLKQTDMPEDIIYWVLIDLKIPRILWEEYFSLELTKLHGWTGFIKWRYTSDGAYQKKYPVFLEEFLAIRLYYSYMLLKDIESFVGFFPNMENIIEYVINKKEIALLRYDFNSSKLLPDYFEEVESKNFTLTVYEKYICDKKEHQYISKSEFIYSVLSLSLSDVEIENLNEDEVLDIYKVLNSFIDIEGFVMQKAMERSYMYKIMQDTVASIKTQEDEKTYNAQLFFCIDVRSERIRRNIEKVGSYDTFGIAGFFGIPLKLIDVKNQCETSLCPAVVIPKNVVYSFYDPNKKSTQGVQKLIKKVMHDLKYNVLTPYITVEVVGALFGFDFFGKSLAASSYMPFREKVFNSEDEGDLKIERYSEQEANSIINTIQKVIIKKVIDEHFKISRKVEDESAINEILKLALGEEDLVYKDQDGTSIEPATKLGLILHLMRTEEQEFITLLRDEYKISATHMRLQKRRMAKVGFGFKEQLFHVENAFKLVGLTDNFADIVVLCGHESRSENNPYESALDCGACGGNGSGTNARVLAYMANKPDIRERLKHRGIIINDNTLFVAGSHNTTSDTIKIYDEGVPGTHKVELEKLKVDLAEAGIATAHERISQLPFGKNKTKIEAKNMALKNTMDWSQPRPEWGLSKNHSFLVGKRENSKDINFDGRTFLHSYDYKKDPNGSMLEIILSGPLVVCEWINMEHFFSSMDNDAYGSNSKVYHNVVGKLGVIFGNMSDLKVGLPSQTVHHRGKPYHEPIRLITVIEAPFEKYRSSIDKMHKVSELVYNEWIKILFLDKEKEAFYYYCGFKKDWIEIAFERIKHDTLK